MTFLQCDAARPPQCTEIPRVGSPSYAYVKLDSDFVVVHLKYAGPVIRTVVDVGVEFQTRVLLDFGAQPGTIVTGVILALAVVGFVLGCSIAIWSVRQGKPDVKRAGWITHFISYLMWGACYASVYLTVHKLRREGEQWSASRRRIVIVFCVLEGVAVSAWLLGIAINVLALYQSYMNFNYCCDYTPLIVFAVLGVVRYVFFFLF